MIIVARLDTGIATAVTGKLRQVFIAAGDLPDGLQAEPVLQAVQQAVQGFVLARLFEQVAAAVIARAQFPAVKADSLDPDIQLQLVHL